jgi:superfamily II DNA or RNA helicase
MYTLRKRAGIAIPRTYENDSFYVKMRAFLTRRSMDYHQESVFIVHRFFLESEKFLTVPRFFPVYEYIPECHIEDHSHVGEDIKINHKIKFRDELQENMANHMLNSDNATIQAPPGSGKTVVALYVIATRKKKTLVLVHRDSLVDQWAERALEHTDINRNDVVRLTSSNFIHALKKPLIITTDQTFVSILKRNRYNFLVALNQANIGMFIADEVHTSVGAPRFSECSLHMPARLTYGLSATPYRYDGNGDVINFHLGETYVPEGEASVMDAKVTVVLFDSGMLNRSFKYVYWGDKFQRARYLNLLKKSNIFMSLCKGLLTKFSSNGREVIFVSERIKMIEELFKWLNIPSKSKFIRSATNEELRHQVTFATPGKIRDGVDIPKKDCLIMTSPIKNVEQMCGRVVREADDKSRPVVVDMIDIGVIEIRETYYGRLRYYQDKQWERNYLIAYSDGRIVEIDEQIAIEIIRGE